MLCLPHETERFWLCLPLGAEFSALYLPLSTDFYELRLLREADLCFNLRSTAMSDLY